MTGAVSVEIELDGTRRRVSLRREGDGWIAELDGRVMEVSIVESGSRWSTLVRADLPPNGGSHNSDCVASTVGRKSYEVAFEQAADGALTVYVNGVAVSMTVHDRRYRRRRGTKEGDDGGGPRTIVAPMPGRIVKVLVKPDEAVSARQPLVVVEAMKMENELRAPRGGVVAEIRVAEGASVEANAVLVVLR